MFDFIASLMGIVFFEEDLEHFVDAGWITQQQAALLSNH